MAQSPSTAIRDAIAAAIEQFMAAFSRGDAAGAALYTADGQLLPPNSDVIAGKQAIQTFWQSAMHMGITAVKLETVEVEGHGHTANEVGRTSSRVPGARYLTRGSTSSFGNKRRGSGSCTVISGIAAGQRQGSNPEPSPGIHKRRRRMGELHDHEHRRGNGARGRRCRSIEGQPARSTVARWRCRLRRGPHHLEWHDRPTPGPHCPLCWRCRRDPRASISPGRTSSWWRCAGAAITPRAMRCATAA